MTPSSNPLRIPGDWSPRACGAPRGVGLRLRAPQQLVDGVERGLPALAVAAVARVHDEHVLDPVLHEEFDDDARGVGAFSTRADDLVLGGRLGERERLACSRPSAPSPSPRSAVVVLVMISSSFSRTVSKISTLSWKPSTISSMKPSSLAKRGCVSSKSAAAGSRSGRACRGACAPGASSW
jgi:hypothetical protein